MLLTRTFLTKSNTIVKDSCVNLGLNPLIELHYGNLVSRGIIYFDHSRIKALLDDKTYPDVTKLKHVLHMTNTCGSSEPEGRCGMDRRYGDEMLQRVGSFDLVFFIVPQPWDAGNGFDYTDDIYHGYHKGYRNSGSNWTDSSDYVKWQKKGSSKIEPQAGMYSNEVLEMEIEKFLSPEGNKSDIVIGYQHFEYGNEPISIDITDTVNKFVTGEICNNGIGFAFSPKYEMVETEKSQYVAFYGPHTNSLFKPYVETVYEDHIDDNRTDFYLDKDNKLYFYAIVGGEQVNLDKLPTCSINGADYPVKQATKGVYYIEVNLSSSEYDAEMMLYDLWSDLYYNGKKIPDVELYFTTKAPEGYFTFGLPSNGKNEKVKIEPYLYGISDNERVQMGDIRKVTIDCKIPYTTNQVYGVEGLEYRLYVIQGKSEIDIISWMPVEHSYLSDFFYINTNELVPCEYFIDIKAKYDYEEKIHKEMLKFHIVDDRTEVYN